MGYAITLSRVGVSLQECRRKMMKMTAVPNRMLPARGGVTHVTPLFRNLRLRAAAIARRAGYARLAVISGVGTRAWYRRLGFSDGVLYQVTDT